MKKITSSIILLFFSLLLIAQTATGNIEIYMADIIDNAPGSSGDNYVVPSTSELNKWDSVIDFIFIDNLIEARSNSSTLNYQITEFTDTSVTPNQIFYVLEEKSPQSNYWGTYVFSKTPTRNNLIIQAPHSKYDTNTGKQAIYCFKNNITKAVFINGTHRCNSDNFSTCSGTTSVCGSNEAYRVSDLAHNVNSMFQKTTENIFNKIPNSVFIQLHGFGKKTTDPYVIMSNGTRETPTIDYVTLIKEELLVEDNTLTFKLAHLNQDWTRLIGFTNTQGRMINNSSNYCNTSATSTTGRFIHIEQEKTKLRNNETGWRKMSNALSRIFTSTLGTEDIDFDKVITVSPNPTKGKLIVTGNHIERVTLYNLYGQRIAIQYNFKKHNSINFELNEIIHSRGVYVLKITTNVGIISRKIIYM